MSGFQGLALLYSSIIPMSTTWKIYSNLYSKLFFNIFVTLKDIEAVKITCIAGRNYNIKDIVKSIATK